MIKKNTKIIFQDTKGKTSKEWDGGIPLSIGDKMTLENKNHNSEEYKVVDKIIDCVDNDIDQIVNITYVLKKM